MEQSPQPTLDPWFSIWTRPRATLRQLLDSNTDLSQQVLLLAALSGIIESFNRASARSVGDSLSLGAIVVFCLFVGSLGGLLSVYIGGALLGWMGRQLGGVGPNDHVRAAIAWASVPRLWGSILLILQIGIYGKELFTTETPRIDASPVLELLLLGFGIIEIVIGIWAFVVFLKCLGEAHRFSAWRALGTSFLAGLLIAIPIMCLVGLALLGRSA
jgi:hypothetical protein